VQTCQGKPWAKSDCAAADQPGPNLQFHGLHHHSVLLIQRKFWARHRRRLQDAVHDPPHGKAMTTPRRSTPTQAKPSQAKPSQAKPTPTCGASGSYAAVAARRGACATFWCQRQRGEQCRGRP
jgi:hypothetical protein